ncbi:hypothetical protein CRG98_022043, partial [Punica granatum]
NGGPQSIRGRGHQSAILTHPLRLSASSVGASALGGGFRVVDWLSRPRIDRGLRLEVPGRFGIGVTNRRPRPLHRGCQHPQKMLAPSVKGLGSLIGSPDPESTGDSNSGSPIDSGGRRRPMWVPAPQWRVRDCQLAALTPSPFNFSLYD